MSGNVELYTSQKSVNRSFNHEGDDIEELINKATAEVVGTRNKQYKRKGLNIWNHEVLEQFLEEKKTIIVLLKKEQNIR